jgi:hypothetical protein
MNVLVVVGKARTEVPRHVRLSIIDVYHAHHLIFYLLCTTPTPLHYLMCILVVDVCENRFLGPVRPRFSASRHIAGILGTSRRVGSRVRPVRTIVEYREIVTLLSVWWSAR